MTPRHTIKRSAAALALIGLLMQPAQAQVTTVDPAHISLQLQSWASNLAEWVKNFEQWQNDAKRWVSNIKSEVSNAFDINLLTSTDISSGQQDKLDELVKKLKQADPCKKITDDTAKGLCTTEQTFKTDRAQLLVNALKATQPHLDKIQALSKELKSAVAAGESSASGATGQGDSVNSNKAKIAALQAEIVVQQNKITEKMMLAKNDIELADSKIKIVNSVRVDYAKTQLEGKEPGVFDKLLSTAAVAGTLTVAEQDYKSKIEAKKKLTSGY